MELDSIVDLVEYSKTLMQTFFPNHLPMTGTEIAFGPILLKLRRCHLLENLL